MRTPHKTSMWNYILGKGWFLLDVQVRKANPYLEFVEGGYRLAMYVNPGICGRNNNLGP